MSWPNVHAFFREVVAAHRDRAALIWSANEVTTFGELDCLAETIALFLQQQGVQKGDPVGIRLDKCKLAYALIVGCLRLGAPYFFVDPSNPVARILSICDKCKPKVVFSAAEPPLPHLSAHRVLTIEPNEDFSARVERKGKVLLTEPHVTGADAAYIMFTSGSTGIPKGAVMSHANLLYFIRWARSEFAITPHDAFTSVNPLFFDNSVFDFYASILNGAALVPFDAATMKDPCRVLQRIDDLHCTIYFSVPSLLVYFQTLRLITRTSFLSLRTIIFGGEGYPKVKLKELFQCLHPRTELINVYGPTECTCICSAYRVTAPDFIDLSEYAPLGGPISNFSFLILNGQGREVAAGEVGELYLGGPCVGLGYFGDDELTRKSFIQNPLNPNYRERLYRTGDLVSISVKDSKVRFVGRKDSQIKHQGYRIELGEIEHALARIAGVDEAVALQTRRDGFSSIIAVVGSSSGLPADALREEAAKSIPGYMIPDQIEVLDTLPRNANGKIDRRLLKTRYCKL